MTSAGSPAGPPVAHQGELMGIAPTGNHINVTTLGIWRVRDGKISEAWLVFDALGMSLQLGVTSSP
jgi:predicted ester cyclase